MAEHIFIITCHEHPKTIVDLVCNLKAMNPNVKTGFCLHISKGFLFHDKDDYKYYRMILDGKLFPESFNVKINPKRFTTKWGSLSAFLVDTLNYAHKSFENAKYFIFVASNCLQTCYNPPLINHKQHYIGPYQFGHLPKISVPIDDENPYLKNKFINYLYKNFNSAKFTIGIHEGLYMSTEIAKDFLDKWYTVYSSDEEILEDNKLGCTEEYIFDTYFSTQMDKVHGLSLCVRQPEYIDVVENPTREFFMVKPVHRRFDLPLRKKMREKYKYDKTITEILETKEAENYINRPTIVYLNKNEKQYESKNKDFQKIDDIVQGNIPRIIHMEIKTDSPYIHCLLSTGSAKQNNCLNILIEKYIKIMCYGNDFYKYDTKDINDGLWHSVCVIYSDSKLWIYVDKTKVFETKVNDLFTLYNNSYIGKSNHTGFERYYNGSMKNVLILEGDYTSHDKLFKDIDLILNKTY